MPSRSIMDLFRIGPAPRRSRRRRAPRRQAAQANYPATVREIVEDVRYRRGVLTAMRRFKRSKPYRGPINERIPKFDRLLRDLSRLYGLRTPVFGVHHIDPNATTGNGRCCRRPGERTRITLFGKLSVVTFLHEFAHARGMDERQACRWSVNLFRRVFPVLYARAQHSRHMVVAR